MKLAEKFFQTFLLTSLDYLLTPGCQSWITSLPQDTNHTNNCLLQSASMGLEEGKTNFPYLHFQRQEQH